MPRLQELVRLHRLGVTERRAAKELRMGRNTAREYREAIAAAGLLEGTPEELPELEMLQSVVAAALPARTAPQQVSTLESWQPDVEMLLEKRLGPQAIYDRLRLEHPEFRRSLGSLKRLVRRIRQERGRRRLPTRRTRGLGRSAAHRTQSVSPRLSCAQAVNRQRWKTRLSRDH